jgi:hypothetical protein
MFQDFDFKLLDSPEFKEDSVREEIIVPILRRLGYSASPPNQIKRSVALAHPYVQIGSKRHQVNIIPDYLLIKDGVNHFILDAKAPSENIQTGKNVEQAYSYAIHSEVRTGLYALCNGYEFTLFSISHIKPILSFKVNEIEKHWISLAHYVATNSVFVATTFLPDLGLGLVRMGFAVKENKEKIVQIFSMVDIETVDRIDNDTYGIQAQMTLDNIAFHGSFDFPTDKFDRFLKSIYPAEVRNQIEQALIRNPFHWQRTEHAFAITGFCCEISDYVHENGNEAYTPFIVRDFIVVE